MLTDVYVMLRDGVEFEDLGGQYFVQRDKGHTHGEVSEKRLGIAVLQSVRLRRGLG